MKNVAGKTKSLKLKVRTHQETTSSQSKTSGTQVARAIPEAQIRPFWVEGDE
jgi:hypothetical protein